MASHLLELVALGALATSACGYPPLPRLGDDGAPDAVPSSIDALPAHALPGCVELATTCGAIRSDSCCNSPEVPGGVMYYRGYDVAADSGSGDKSAPAIVSNFRLDKYDVTVGRFRAFVNAGMGTQTSPPSAGAGAHVKILGSGWDPAWNGSLVADTASLKAALTCDNPAFQTWTDAPAANEDRPINCITWYEAMSFCAWDGGYLPTEAEWNYAAAGGDQQRAYPWSNPPGATSIDDSHASYMDGQDCLGDGMPGCGLTDIVAVGTKPAGDGRWGQSDLAGNVYTWILDWYSVAYISPCADCANLTVADYRLTHGGSWGSTAPNLRTTFHEMHPPSDRDFQLGARCARIP